MHRPLTCKAWFTSGASPARASVPVWLILHSLWSLHQVFFPFWKLLHACIKSCTVTISVSNHTLSARSARVSWTEFQSRVVNCHIWIGWVWKRAFFVNKTVLSGLVFIDYLWNKPQSISSEKTGSTVCSSQWLCSFGRSRSTSVIAILWESAYAWLGRWSKRSSPSSSPCFSPCVVFLRKGLL